MCLLIWTVSQVSDVAHGPLVFFCFCLVWLHFVFYFWKFKAWWELQSPSPIPFWIRQYILQDCHHTNLGLVKCNGCNWKYDEWLYVNFTGPQYVINQSDWLLVHVWLIMIMICNWEIKKDLHGAGYQILNPPPKIIIIKPNKQNHSFICVLQNIHVVGV